MGHEEDYYPQWLYKDLIEDLLPWDRAATRTFTEFLSIYTLHDSSWVGIFQHVGAESSLTLCMIWDSIWLPEGIVPKSSLVASWPLLFVRVEDVVQVSLNGYKDIQGCGRTIGKCEVENINGQELLIISDVFGGEIAISFFGRVRFLALTRDRQTLSI